MNQIPQQLRKLKHLSIEGPTYGLNKDDFHVALFINNEFGMKIESLRLEKCDSLSDKECCDVVQSCPNLVVFSIQGCKGVSLQGIAEALSKAKKLKHLNIAFLGNVSNVNIQDFGELTELVIDEASLKKINILGQNDELKNIVKV